MSNVILPALGRWLGWGSKPAPTAPGGGKPAPQRPATPTPAYPGFSLDTRDGVMAVQAQLCRLGYLDPPADGGLGGTTRWALGAMALDVLGHRGADDAGALQALSRAGSLPLDLSAHDLPARIVSAMIARGYFVARRSDCVNIVYVEGMNPDGTTNDNVIDQFNDIRTVIRIGKNGQPAFDGIWEATTEPGIYWGREHSMNPDGPFHIAFGQYKAWCLGMHHTHEAWVQCGTISGYRDPRMRGERDLLHPVSGSDMGVNQHWGYDLPRNRLANSSAGCLVGRETGQTPCPSGGHLKFMKITKGDARFVANGNYRVMATVLPAKDVA